MSHPLYLYLRDNFDGTSVLIKPGTDEHLEYLTETGEFASGRSQAKKFANGIWLRALVEKFFSEFPEKNFQCIGF